MTDGQKKDRKSTEEIERETAEALLENGTVPKAYLDKPRYMAAAIRHITDWEHCRGGHYTSELEQSAYCLLVDCLAGLLTEPDGIQILERVNGNLAAGTLEDWMESAIDDYVTAARERPIKNHQGYMRSVIKNSLSAWQAKLNASIERCFGAS